MLSHRGADEIHLVAIAPHTDQAEVACTTAHIANHYHLPIEELLARLRQIVANPRIKCRGRFFKQYDMGQARVGRRAHRQLPRFFVEAGWHREHNLLLRQRRASRSIPFLPHLSQKPARYFYRRKHPPRFGRIPRQYLRGPVYGIVRKPALCRMHQPRRHQRALITGISAHRFPFFQQQKRRQRAAGFHTSSCHQLRNRKHLHRGKQRVFRIRWIDVSQRGIRRP